MTIISGFFHYGLQINKCLAFSFLSHMGTTAFPFSLSGLIFSLVPLVHTIMLSLSNLTPDNVQYWSRLISIGKIGGHLSCASGQPVLCCLRLAVASFDVNREKLNADLLSLGPKTQP